ncbi:u27-Nephitoxin-Nsp1a_1 [Nephila pilipes]|uniref:U27-Nephitoxin-Nsp1a_1 n=1 Tax=Nephila pilipes TaxID=299642 RepID=A0A8X6K7S9_NEPPI|nr:u27-Nephitoxin-Nsp1a_1 [Nephila pilipes]
MATPPTGLMLPRGQTEWLIIQKRWDSKTSVMQKLAIVIALTLMLNLTFGFEAKTYQFLNGHMGEFRNHNVTPDPNCRKEGQSCTNVKKCCPGFDCNQLVLGLGFSSIRCGPARKKT